MDLFVVHLNEMCVCFQELLNEARQRLVSVAKDPARYSALIDGLLLQVRGNLMLINHIDAFYTDIWMLLISSTKYRSIQKEHQN